MMNDNKNNTGSGNNGDCNTGDWNTGNCNTGNCNTGNCNTGNCNTGNWNTGSCNTGNCNTGNWSTGDWNTGNWNTGYANSTNRSSGIFCTEEPKLISFNKPTDKLFSEIDHPHFMEFYLTKWISDEKMTDQEKKDNPTFHTCLGYLKKYEYKEAWANFWRDTDEANRQKFLALPNFDTDIFLEITGIDLKKKEITCEGKEVEIDGKTYVLKLKD